MIQSSTFSHCSVMQNSLKKSLINDWLLSESRLLFIFLLFDSLMNSCTCSRGMYVRTRALHDVHVRIG